MSGYDAIVNPVVGKNTAPIGPVAVMAACEPDVKHLSGLLGHNSENVHPVMISRLYLDPERSDTTALIGPMIGAPYATMLLETLIVRGARRVIFMGWCGALDPDLRIGDLIIPTAAIIDEGTSPHYPPVSSQSTASAEIIAAIGQVVADEEINARQAVIWTTDAAFRETRERVTSFQKLGAVAVDMETSALYSVAAYRRIEIGAILVVSDSLAGDSWLPGFHRPQFKTGRSAACHLVDTLCRKLHLLK